MKKVEFSDKVYEKDFHIKSIGYDCQEVDAFLDEINLQIVKLEREIVSLKEAKSTLEATRMALEQKNKDLQIDNAAIKASSTVTTSSNANFSNIQLLNRISNLETMVKKLLEKIENQ